MIHCRGLEEGGGDSVRDVQLQSLKGGTTRIQKRKNPRSIKGNE